MYKREHYRILYERLTIVATPFVIDLILMFYNHNNFYTRRGGKRCLYYDVTLHTISLFIPQHAVVHIYPNYTTVELIFYYLKIQTVCTAVGVYFSHFLRLGVINTSTNNNYNL